MHLQLNKLSICRAPGVATVEGPRAPREPSALTDIMHRRPALRIMTAFLFMEYLRPNPFQLLHGWERRARQDVGLGRCYGTGGVNVFRAALRQRRRPNPVTMKYS
ncbi:hypothetical protein EVAR_22953_1 [Eumeta japonica]|uniref:Uncharacterized protein n=1 Tax=Eumeta variegata TaxID=151549 RepID=A0A4C1UQJ2_EUMVA|nr:hypothetical protein EVAR_22953_1 [Eumeta japonica]